MRIGWWLAEAGPEVGGGEEKFVNSGPETGVKPGVTAQKTDQRQ